MRECILDHGGQKYRAALRPLKSSDTRVLVEVWAPALARGPRHWLDRDWAWESLDEDAAFPVDAETWVIVDELEPGATKDVLGVFTVSGPHQPSEVGLNAEFVVGSLLWLEYIAIAPSLRRDCPDADARRILLKRVGASLMLAAIDRSEDLGCHGAIGLYAEGSVAREAYLAWKMQRLPDAPHPTGGSYPVFFGNPAWAKEFRQRVGGGK